MSRRANAPYSDLLADSGRTIIYEGHDIPRRPGGPEPKSVDQTAFTESRGSTENGRFVQAALAFKQGKRVPEMVRVYEKILNGIWSYNGTFDLIDAWQEPSNERKVFKFRLELTDDSATYEQPVLAHTRVIPSEVKLAVWRRDKARCVVCGDSTNLHFDHIIPYALGGSSLTADNIQLLCVRHNLAKHARIE